MVDRLRPPLAGGLSGVSRPPVRGTHLKKPSISAGLSGVSAPSGRAASRVVASRGHFRPSVLTDFTYTPDTPDKPSNGAGFASPPPRTKRAEPRTEDHLDALRDDYGAARGVEAKREVVRAWARAAGGDVIDGALVIPPGLPNSLTLATLKTYARCVGIGGRRP